MDVSACSSGDPGRVTPGWSSVRRAWRQASIEAIEHLAEDGRRLVSRRQLASELQHDRAVKGHPEHVTDHERVALDLARFDQIAHVTSHRRARPLRGRHELRIALFMWPSDAEH